MITHGKVERIRTALERLERVAAGAGVDLLFDSGEREKHARDPEGADHAGADLCVVLGGDGTMLRALQQFLDTDVPVIGVNYGRVGFLASVDPEELESALMRVFAGEYVVEGLATLDVTVGGERYTGVNDAVATSSVLGRMVELGWAIGGEDLGRQPCDGIICATPSGSTAYNLSNGGPVLVRGLDAMAITFVAPHSLHARPLVVPRGSGLEVTNRTPDVGVTVLVDGHRTGEVEPGGRLSIALGSRRSLLATLPETTFFGRYREVFAS